MKSRLSIGIAAVAIFVVLAIPVSILAHKNEDQRHKQVHYFLTVLGTLGGTVSEGQGGINNRGQITGWSSLPNAAHAFLWQHGIMTDLGSLQGGPVSSTFAPANEHGDVAGFSNTQVLDPNGEDFCGVGTFLVCLGFLWHDGVMTALPTLGGNNSYAYQINNRGQIVGLAENTITDSTCPASYLQAKPVVWQHGGVQELPTFAGDPDGFGYGINDRGQIVGATGGCNESVPFSSNHAVLWPDGPSGSVIDLGNFGGSTLNIAFDINTRGQIVGQAGVPGGVNFHAFLWQKSVMTDLGTLPGDVQSWANIINNKNQIVGTSFDPNGNGRAFVWQNAAMIDLNTLIPADSPLYLDEAFGINDRGQITGFGHLANGDQRAYLLDPCENNDHRSCDAAADTSAAVLASTQAPEVAGPTLPGMPWRRSNRFHRPALEPRN
jgi:probable HAF family extracellular repeat protein